MFYNDMPVDYIFYAALSHAALGEIGAAERIADSFADYAAANKGKHVKIDYFAVSLPDLLVWDLTLTAGTTKCAIACCLWQRKSNASREG